MVTVILLGDAASKQYNQQWLCQYSVGSGCYLSFSSRLLLVLYLYIFLFLHKHFTLLPSSHFIANGTGPALTAVRVVALGGSLAHRQCPGLLPLTVPTLAPG